MAAATPSDAQQAATPTARRTEPDADPSSKWTYIIGLCTAAILICYADRSNVSVAILEMAKDYNWDEVYKGTILSVFFIGYSATQLLGGTLADRYGGKSVLTVGVVTWSLFTFLTPQAAMGGGATLISCRILMGIGEGVAFPAVHSIVAGTVPREWQSSAVATITAASYAGAALATAAAPWLIAEYEWPSVFYVFGAFAILWLPFWLATPVPSAQPLPTGGAPEAGDGEARPLVAAVEEADAEGAGQDDGELGLLDAAPTASTSSASEGWAVRALGLDAAFLALAKRKEVWAICVAQFGQSWGMYTLLNWLPSFFTEQYAVDVADLGKYTVVPPLLQAAVGFCSGGVADRLIARGVSVRATRRSLQLAGMLGPAGCLLLAVSPALENSPASASLLITAAQGLSALTLGAVSVSQLDIAPKHAGAIFGLGNTFATVAGLLGTRITGDILQATHSWALVFGLASANYVVGAGVWYLWVGSERLPEDAL